MLIDIAWFICLFLTGWCLGWTVRQCWLIKTQMDIEDDEEVMDD